MTECKKVFLDTAPFIYYIEGNVGNPEYSKKAKFFFKNSYESGKKLITSVITIEEYKVFPYRTNNQESLNAFERLLSLTGVDVIDIDREIAEKAAKIRAEYRNFKSMDALQLATACVMGCDLFLTNDKQLRQFKEMKCVTIEELE